MSEIGSEPVSAIVSGSEPVSEVVEPATTTAIASGSEPVSKSATATALASEPVSKSAPATAIASGSEPVLITLVSSRIPTSLFLLSTILLSTTNRKGSISEPGSLPIGIARYIGDNPGSVAPGSVAPGSVAPGSVAPGSVAPGSVAPGSEPIAIAQYIEPNSGSGLQPIIPELPQDLIALVESFMKLHRDVKMKEKLKQIDRVIDTLSDISQLNEVLKPFNINITTDKICIDIQK